LSETYALNIVSSVRLKRSTIPSDFGWYGVVRIATDILGELPETENGNKYILVVSDYFTKWTEAFAMANMETYALNIVSRVRLKRSTIPSDFGWYGVVLVLVVPSIWHIS
jgi:hypothetical protein